MNAISPGEASSFQQRYQELIGTILSELVGKQKDDLEEHREEEREATEVRLTDGDRVVYGQVGDKFRNEVSPETIQDLERIASAPVGSVVDRAALKTLEVDGQVVLQTDENGKVVLNSLYEELEAINSAEVESDNTPHGLSSSADPGDPGTNDSDPSSNDGASSEGSSLETEALLQQIFGEPLLAFSELPDEPANENENEKETLDLGSYTVADENAVFSGSASSSLPIKQQDETLAQVQSSVQELPNLALQEELLAQINSMQQLQKQQQEQQEEQNHVLQQLVEQRLAQPEKTSWWQDAKNFVGQLFQSGRDRVQEYSAAVALKDLFHSKSPDGRTYESEDYSIKREAQTYTFADKSGKTLMQFDSTPIGVPIVNRQSVDFSDTQKKDLKQLSAHQFKREDPSGAFAPIGSKETEYLGRVNNITQALTQYAARSKQAVQVDGQLSYKWKAAPDGSVRIDAKDGRGPLLLQSNGQIQSRMTERDLAHFERLLPQLNPRQRTVANVSSNGKSSTAQIAWDRN